MNTRLLREVEPFFTLCEQPTLCDFCHNYPHDFDGEIPCPAWDTGDEVDGRVPWPLWIWNYGQEQMSKILGFAFYAEFT